MPVWLRLSITEFFRSLVGKPKYAGSADFRLFLLFQILIICLLGVTWTASIGVNRQLESALFGRVDDAGIPVSLRLHYDMASRIGGFDRDDLARFGWHDGSAIPNEAMNSSVLWPYSRLESGETGFEIPGDGSWTATSNPVPGIGTDVPLSSVFDGMGLELDDTPFDGWALFQNDPLWKKLMSGDIDTRSPHLVASEQMFEMFFQYPVYYASMREILPIPLADMMAEPEDNGLPINQQMDYIWLKAGGDVANNGFIRFQIHWTPAISPDNSVAYVMPIDVIHRLRASDNGPIALDSTTSDAVLVEAFSFLPQDLSGDAVAVRANEIASCLRGSLDLTSFDPIIRLPYPMTRDWVQLCLDRTETKPEDVAIVGNAINTVSTCADGTGMVLESARDQEGNCIHQLANRVYDAIEQSPFSRFRVYIPNGAELSDTLDLLTGTENDAIKVFLLDPSYDAALRRLDYIKSVLNWLSSPVIILALLFLFFAMSIKIMALVHHRRVNCGILLADGLSRGQIVRIFNCQIVVSTLISTSIAALILLSGISMINALFVNNADIQEIAELLNLEKHEIVTSDNLIFITLIGGLFAYTVSRIAVGIALYVLPLRRGTEPTELMS